MPAGFVGTLTFESTQKLAAITLRQSKNRQGEPLYTTLPVVDLGQSATSDPVVFPQIAAGEGYETPLILINSTGLTERGQVTCYGDDGSRLILSAGGTESAQFGYEIAPHGTHRIGLGSSGLLRSGYAIVVPEAGTTSPRGSAVFRFVRDGYVVTEAGVGATTASTAARIFADQAGSYTGVALVNRESQASTVTFALLDRNGLLIETATRTLPGGGHVAVFAHELFPGLGDKFTGLMEITSAAPFSAITLKLVINARGDLVYTTLPVADLNRPPSAIAMVFPQIAFGEGFTTQQVLLSTDKTRSATGRLAFYRSDATPMSIQFGNQVASQFPYRVAAGGGIQFFPGNTARIASISLIDPQSGRVVVADGAGKAGEITYGEPQIKSVTPDRISIKGGTPVIIKGKNFAPDTLVVLAGILISRPTVVDTQTITFTTPVLLSGQGILTVQNRAGLAQSPVMVDPVSLSELPRGYITTVAGGSTYAGEGSGATGVALSTAGLAVDTAGNVLIADIENYRVRKMDGKTGVVTTVAGNGRQGIARESGVATALSLNGPGSLAFDAAGNLYILDSSVRKVDASTAIISTVGGGKYGFCGDGGKATEACFDYAAGVAIDSVGNLFIADRFNHRVRKIDASNGIISTVAGNGQPSPFAGMQ